MRKKKYLIDASLFTSESQAHEIMKKEFRGYEYYGNNLDALHDVLTSISRDVTVTVRSLDKAERVLGTYAATLRRVFTDSAEENGHITLRFEEDA